MLIVLAKESSGHYLAKLPMDVMCHHMPRSARLDQNDLQAQLILNPKLGTGYLTGQCHHTQHRDMLNSLHCILPIHVLQSSC